MSNVKANTEKPKRDKYTWLQQWRRLEIIREKIARSAKMKRSSKKWFMLSLFTSN